MEENKFQKFFCFVDFYSIDQKDVVELTEEEMDSSLIFYFIHRKPLYIGVLMNYLKMIIEKICAENKKDDIIPLIEEIKNNPDNFIGKYDYRDITLNKLFKGDYEFLKSHAIINAEVIVNEESFLKNFYVAEDPTIVYPFSIKEYYTEVLKRAINITIKNYYF